jgi:hypothetical protein
VKQTAIEMQWHHLQQLRQAVRDAPTCPTRLQALCNYQGELHRFVDAHGHTIELALARLAANR